MGYVLEAIHFRTNGLGLDLCSVWLADGGVGLICLCAPVSNSTYDDRKDEEACSVRLYIHLYDIIVVILFHVTDLTSKLYCEEVVDAHYP